MLLTCAILCFPATTKFSSYILAVAWTFSPLNSMGLLYLLQYDGRRGSVSSRSVELGSTGNVV